MKTKYAYIFLTINHSTPPHTSSIWDSTYTPAGSCVQTNCIEIQGGLQLEIPWPDLVQDLRGKLSKLSPDPGSLEASMLPQHMISSD